MKRLIIILLFVVINSSGCDEKKEVVRSFCYWKTSAYFDKEEDSICKNLNVKHMYVRFFDVDWNPYTNEPLPVATISRMDFNESNLKITPSIFITNDVVLKASKDQLDSLAKKIQKRIKEIGLNYNKEKADKIASTIVYSNYEKQKVKKTLNLDSIKEIELAKLKSNFEEILIDCDWTEKSKDNYFYLLQQIKKEFKSSQLAATIRLWQYKYCEKAGVPPVDRGLLMCYNLSSPNDYKTKNSIGTSDELEKYITHSDYDLGLDIALPLYSWSVVFRGNQFKGIISDYEQFIKDTSRIKKIANNKYLLQDDVLIGQTYLRNGDEIRIEKISDEEIKKMISIIKNRIPFDNHTKVTFFSFDKKYIHDYGIKNISGYYAHFQ
ncbi:hypothetical protein OIU80_04965 [Flavobacterium sp. LS1R47]|uniref:Uncharacterized protein n=1 Tax=Flavobacterium frigoritolerans TaxID=2987686 RepID=A0A9X2YZC4_9FLAO|nr:hypothetical protein [Flavobacterium frigoritolerans]MCV9931624.1 hypothetical protein [Flavobacterium frigoritolerans]